MASITIRKLEVPLKAQLKIQAAQHGRSMEEEARHILRKALVRKEVQSSQFGQLLHQRFSVLGGVELSLPLQEPLRDPPPF